MNIFDLKKRKIGEALLANFSVDHKAVCSTMVESQSRSSDGVRPADDPTPLRRIAFEDFRLNL
jgi:hypothetical protein